MPTINMPYEDGLAEILPELGGPERGIGDNNPPDPVELLRTHLAETHKSLIARRDELLAAYERAPATVESDEDDAKFATLCVQLAKLDKSAETTRVAVKDPFLTLERAVDGFFNTILLPIRKAKTALAARQTIFKRRKAAEELARRNAELNRQREEQNRARIAAEQALAQLDEAAATADASTADVVLDDAVRAALLVKQAGADVATAQREANAPAKDLARTRADTGAVSSLSTFWDFTNLDRETLDLEPLRAHIGMEALEKAVRSFIKAGGRNLRGVEIFENNRTQNRG
jgi:hypothetical protein